MRRRVERARAKTARWVILPTCSYSYEHAALLITSNYNTCRQCILRYANLVSRPLVLMHVALQEGKWDKWAAANRIMHKRSPLPEDIAPVAAVYMENVTGNRC